MHYFNKKVIFYTEKSVALEVSDIFLGGKIFGFFFLIANQIFIIFYINSHKKLSNS